MKYRSCNSLERNKMYFHGNFDEGANVINFCCADEAPNLSVGICDDPEETIKSYMARRDAIINESMRFAALGTDPPPEERGASKPCSRCGGFVEKDWPAGEYKLIDYINFGQRPTPCQSKCIYCSQNLENRRKYDKKLDNPQHELVMKTVRYALESGLIPDTALWEIASGEIAVHPFKEEIYDIVGTRTAGWLTNCFIYEERIGANLRANPASYINFSMDSGTPETWLKIKGVDNFEKVMDNLVKYYAASQRSTQIVLKYILLPGINDNPTDFISFIEIAKVLECKKIVLSRDRWAPDIDAHIEGGSDFVALLAVNNIEPVLSFFSSEERFRIIEKAEKKMG